MIKFNIFISLLFSWLFSSYWLRILIHSWSFHSNNPLMAKILLKNINKNEKTSFRNIIFHNLIVHL